MTLKVMYVLPKGAKVDNTAPILPYQFAAEEKTGENFKCIVNIVMPLGGSESGLFRYPKKGEKVLVGVEGNGSFLMGYLPEDTADNINTGTNHKSVMPDEMAGQFFRYKGPGDDKDKKDKYSEIGFYHEATKWKAKDAKEADPFPKIDTLRITSEGDINQKARNHNQIKAKRFELLVNCDGSKKTDKESNNEFAFGDQNGDDTELYAGDAHIRAKNRIIIKAEDEIRLEVGRSSIIINDTGVSIVSRKIRSNVSSAWDTSLTLNAADGIFMFGQKVKIDAGVDFLLSEGYGGSVSSKLGVIRINGLDIRLTTINTLNYILKGGLNLASSVFDIAAMGVGMDKGSPTIVSFFRYGRTVGRPLLDFLMPGKLGHFDIKDVSGTLMTALDIFQIILMLTRTVLEMTMRKELNESPHTRDGIYMGFWIAEYALVAAAFGTLSAASIKGAIHESVVWLNSKSEIKINAMELDTTSVAKTKSESPIAGLSESVAIPPVNDIEMTELGG